MVRSSGGSSLEASDRSVGLVTLISVCRLQHAFDAISPRPLLVPDEGGSAGSGQHGWRAVGLSPTQLGRVKGGRYEGSIARRDGSLVSPSLWQWHCNGPAYVLYVPARAVALSCYGAGCACVRASGRAV
jgi:hypothetical protein